MMWYREAYDFVIRTTEQFTMNQWLMILVVVMLVGGLCLRGTGSRKYQ